MWGQNVWQSLPDAHRRKIKSLSKKCSGSECQMDPLELWFYPQRQTLTLEEMLCGLSTLPNSFHVCTVSSFFLLPFLNQVLWNEVQQTALHVAIKSCCCFPTTCNCTCSVWITAVSGTKKKNKKSSIYCIFPLTSSKFCCSSSVCNKCAYLTCMKDREWSTHNVALVKTKVLVKFSFRV